jgi:hypothetical protein
MASMSCGAHGNEPTVPAIPLTAHVTPLNDKDRSKSNSHTADSEIRLDERVDSWLEDIPWSDPSVDNVDPFRPDWPHW